MNTSELLDIDHLLRVVLNITQSLPYGLSGEEQEKNTKLLLEIQKKLLKKLDELVDKAES